jgi:two-component system, cell cycle response regulator CpdR
VTVTMARTKFNDRARADNVLFVEDDYVILMHISQALRGDGFGVIEASNMAEARTALHSWSPIDVAVLDIRLPRREDGLGLVKWIRANRPDVEVVIATGAEADDELRSLAPVVSKPYKPEELVKAVRDVLTKRLEPIARSG